MQGERMRGGQDGGLRIGVGLIVILLTIRKRSPPVLVCLSAHQRTTSLEDLERLSVIGDAAATELTAAHDAIRGAVEEAGYHLAQ